MNDRKWKWITVNFKIAKKGKSIFLGVNKDSVAD